MRILIGIVAGYAIGVVLGVLLVNLLSSNTHDKSQEVAMTAIFVVGPICSIIGGLVGWLGK